MSAHSVRAMKNWWALACRLQPQWILNLSWPFLCISVPFACFVFFIFFVCFFAARQCQRGICCAGKTVDLSSFPWKEWQLLRRIKNVERHPTKRCDAWRDVRKITQRYFSNPKWHSHKDTGDINRPSFHFSRPKCHKYNDQYLKEHFRYSNYLAVAKFVIWRAALYFTGRWFD